MGDFRKLFRRKKLEEIVVIPATLYLPSAIVAQLNEICDQSGFTPGQLVGACVSTVHFLHSFTRSVYDPLLSSNNKSTRRPNGLSVLLRNQTKMIQPIGGKRFPDFEIDNRSNHP
jgi:hypothetical protein